MNCASILLSHAADDASACLRLGQALLEHGASVWCSHHYEAFASLADGQAYVPTSSILVAMLSAKEHASASVWSDVALSRVVSTHTAAQTIIIDNRACSASAVDARFAVSDSTHVVTGTVADALPTILRVIVNGPSAATVISDDSTREWRLGKDWAIRGEPIAALRCFERALQVNSLKANYWNSMGLAYYDLGRYDRALSAYDRALSLKHDFPFVWKNRSACLKKLGRYDEALAALQSAISLDRFYISAWNELIGILALRGRMDEIEPILRAWNDVWEV